MFLNNLKKIFFTITIVGTIFLIYLFIDDYNFKKSKLKDEILIQIKQKELYLQQISYKKFKINHKFPLIISDKMPSKLFGATVLTKDKKIKILLNKKRFKESLDYMINDVFPHEYAHALMFYTNDFSNKNGGHTNRWQAFCKALDGLRCNRFVNHDDVIFGKTNFLD